MQNLDLVETMQAYQKSHEALRACMEQVGKIAMNEPQRTVFEQLRIAEAVHRLFIDSFTKPGSLPFYFINSNPASMGSFGAALPIRREESFDEEDEND